MHALHPAYRVVVTAPDRFGTVGVFFNVEVHRQKCCRTMMLRPVELDAAGNPWSSQPDQRGLDHVLTIDNVAATDLILYGVNAPANFRQQHDADKVVF